MAFALFKAPAVARGQKVTVDGEEIWPDGAGTYHLPAGRFALVTSQRVSSK